MSEWEECKLGDVVTFQRGFDITKKEQVHGVYPVVSSSGIKSYHKSSKVKGPGITIGRKGTLGTVFYLKTDFWPHDTTLWVKDFHGNLPSFIYYFLKEFHFELFDVGSSNPTLNRNHIHPLDVIVPPLPEQKAIASVLSSLDDKIDLLHRQNKTLEAMAETLFRQWFVEEAQEDWEEKVITDLFEIRDGTHDSPKQSQIGRPLITSKHIGTNCIDIKNAYLISEDDFYNVSKRSKVETNDILFSMIGTIGLTYLEQSEIVGYAIKNIGLLKTSQNPDWRYYAFLWINSSLGKEFIHEHRSGSTQEYIALGSLRSIVFDAPPLNLILEFNKVIHAYFQKIKNNMFQIFTLEKLRDTLLPKLMSGEIVLNHDFEGLKD